MVKHKKDKFCPHCGHALRAADSFCAACGNKISGKMSRPRSTQKRQNWIWISALILVVAFAAGFVVVGMSGNEQKEVNRTHNTGLIANVAAEFDCSCGSCDKTLQNCDCPTAKETYSYITQNVEKGKFSRLEIIRMVNDRYGHIINKSVLNG